MDVGMLFFFRWYFFVIIYLIYSNYRISIDMVNLMSDFENFSNVCWLVVGE